MTLSDKRNCDFSSSVINLYQRHARVFDERRGTSLVERPWLERFLRTMPEGVRVLDIGCGSAQPIAAYLVEEGCSVTGIDSAPTLIELCRQRFPAQEWLVADMRGLALERQFGGLLAWDSFFHLSQTDQRAMFAIFREHAAPGAALMFTSGPRQGEAIGSFEDEPLYHASLGPEEYDSLLHQSGFQLVAHRADDPECGGHTVWLARYCDDFESRRTSWRRTPDG